MEVLLLLVMGLTNIACFIIGAKVGQTVVKGEDIKTPSLNPMDAIRASRDRREADKAQERIDTIMRNIEGYDGTPLGQEEVPGR